MVKSASVGTGYLSKRRSAARGDFEMGSGTPNCEWRSAGFQPQIQREGNVWGVDEGRGDGTTPLN